jgi:hypothetical protein
MTKEISKYPYNGVIGEETKIFTDQICRQIVEISYKMVQYFVLLEIKSPVRTKKLYYQLLLFSVYYWLRLQRHGQSEFHTTPRFGS